MILSQHKTSIAPNKCKIKTFEANDADEHAHNLTDWQQEYDQTSAGGFYGSIRELALKDLQVFKEQTSKALNQSCKVWPNSIWLGIPEFSEQESRINGLPVNENTIMSRPGNCEFELVTPENFNIFGIVVGQAQLQTMANIQCIELNWTELTDHGRFDVPESTLTSIRFVLNRLLSLSSEQTPERLKKDILMMALLEVLQKEVPNQSMTPSYGHRKQVVDTVKTHIAQNIEEPLTITDLCEIANVSRRTLQYSFESIMGISPLQFLRMNRLNGVRRVLYHSSQTLPISDIASQWGFWHLSQFSKDYKQLFGELPSETRQRSKHLKLQ
ncbi:helix-turn-helix domain-containing protein [Litoribacillus peritrichatus]|uniref:HTH-type transcriptional regulator EutR n=1 Tax=Litoribacillus peritrichatus TaxID=718191 RepID=A0ABP7MDP7_9GAMM